MKKRIGVLALALVGLMLTVGHATATPYSFYNISHNNAINAASGEDELAMIVTGSGANASFKFYNAGTSSITQIYFEDYLPPLLTFNTLNESAGVSFTLDTTPGNFPAGNEVGFIADYSYDSNSPAPKNGISKDEWLEILFDVSSGFTFDDVIAALDDASLRVGLHVQSYAIGDGSESFVNNPNTPVPEPGTMMLLGAGFLGLAIYGKRRKNS